MRYGLLLDAPSEKDFVFGRSLPMKVVNPSKDWREFMGVPEYQNSLGIEPFACVAFTVLNSVEALIKKQFNEEVNLSDRFLATLAGTRGRGTTPRKAGDILRKKGTPKEKDYPHVGNEDEYFQDIPKKILRLAEKFTDKYDFAYEFVPPNHKDLSSALECSPLLISVSAWTKSGNYYVKPQGAIDNHATTLVRMKEGEYMEVFDSYADNDKDPALKKVAWNALPIVAVRFSVEKRAKKQSWWEWLWSEIFK